MNDKKKQRCDGLANIKAVRLEMSKIYRLHKSDALSDNKARTATSILQAIAKLISDNDFEVRLEALEAAQNIQPKRGISSRALEQE